MSDRETQYRDVRERVGLIDRSETGKLSIVGRDRYTWLQGMVSNDVRLLEQGLARLPACILDPTGHVLTDLALLNVAGDGPLAAALGYSSDFVLLDLPRENLARIAALLDRYLIAEEVEITDVTEHLGCLSFQGPDPSFLLDAGSERGTWDVLPDGVSYCADHTGSGGIDVYFSRRQVGEMPRILGALWENRVGPEAQDLLRIEAGIARYGVDMNEQTIALEANLGLTHISLTKGCYMGQEIIARIDSRGHTNRSLRGLIFEPGAHPAPGDRLYAPSAATDAEARDVGWLTSFAAASPAVGGRPIGLAYVRHEAGAAGSSLRVGGMLSEATVADLPFYRMPNP